MDQYQSADQLRTFYQQLVYANRFAAGFLAREPLVGKPAA